MLKRILFIVWSLWICPPNVHAQSLTDCRNPCEKTRTIRYGAFIGVRIVDSLARGQVYVVEVIPMSAAHQFGVKTGDRLTHLNGVELHSTAQLLNEVARWQPGDDVTLNILRGRQAMELNFPLGAQFSKTITEMVCCDEDSQTALLDFSLSLNPQQDRLTIRCADPLKEVVQVDLLNERGVVCQSERRAGSANVFQMMLQTGTLPQGSYILRIKVGQQQYVKRFVKSK